MRSGNHLTGVGLLAGFLATAAALAAGLFLRGDIALNHDAAWMLVAAGRMLDGGSYAKDFFEVNMPLAIAAYIPPHLLQQCTGWLPDTALRIWTCGLILQSAMLIALLGRTSSDPGVRALASPPGLGFLAITSVLIPGYDFGQREHFIAVLCLPFVVMLADDQPRHSPVLCAWVSLLAAIGALIKPHYAVLPLLLLLVRAAHLRSWKPLRGIETLILLGAGFVDLLVTNLRFSDWYTCARWAADLYGAFRVQHLTDLFDPALVGATAVALVLLLALAWRAGARCGVLRLLLFAALYSAFVYVLQGKGWRYQFLPTSLFLLASIPAALGAFMSGTNGVAGSWWPVAVIGALAAGTVQQAFVAKAQAPRLSDVPEMAIGKILGTAFRGSCIYAFTTSVPPVFPTVTLLNLKWGSRYSALWPLAGLGLAIGNHDPDLQQKLNTYGRPLIDSVVADMTRCKPSLVLVERGPHRYGLPVDFDILGFFLHDPRFRKQWEVYVRTGTSEDFDVYRDRKYLQPGHPQ